MKSKWTFFLVFSITLFVNHSYGQGCSQCKLIAEQASEMDEEAFGNTINYGILYLMAVPYLLILFLFRKQLISLGKRLLRK